MCEAANAQSATLIADAHVSSTQPNINSGALSNLNVGGGYTTLVQFDLSTLPANITASELSRATLRIYCNRADTPGIVSVSPINASWGEYSVTYATLPAIGASAQTANVATAGNFITFDITSIVQGWITAPTTNNGLALTAPSAVVQFDSKENDETAHAPELAIALATGSGAAGPQGLPGPQGPTGPTGAQGAPGIQGPAGPAGASGPAGSIGPAGPSGLQGQAGAQGPKGDTGPQGPSGAKGDTGLQGPAGPQGVPGSTGSPGEQGAQGQQGIPGQAGAQGLTGAKGDTGLQGPMGPQGPAGPVGLSWRGPYSSTTNYALADAVTWQGAGWVSLTASNHGNTPDQSPQAWQMFAAAGAAGATGATGAEGATGPAGPQGLQGPAGANGSAGIAGAPGKPGLVYQGTYQSTTNYALGDVVLWQGASWASLSDANAGQTPSDSPTWWGVLTSQGAIGPQGVAGPQGPIGPQGQQGMQGSTGPAGPQGPVGTQGPAGAQGLQGEKGDRGDTGAAGPPGIAGQAGAQGLTGPQGPTGPAGPQGAAGPAGQNGTQGPQGPAGAVGINFRSGWNTTTQYELNDAVTWNGSTYLAVDASKNIQPDSDSSKWTLIAQAGGAGPTGASGQTPTVTVGTVTTLAPSSSATVSSSLTSTGIALNFGIPQGATGAAGSSGAPTLTPTGNSFAAAYHSVDFGAYYYGLDNLNRSTNEDNTVLTWVPLGCTATQLSVYSLQSSTTLTVSLWNGTPNAMTSTGLSCQPDATTKTCISTGSVVIVPGSFLDLHILNASGSTAPVWTSVQCN